MLNRLYDYMTYIYDYMTEDMTEYLIIIIIIPISIIHLFSHSKVLNYRHVIKVK